MSRTDSFNNKLYRKVTVRLSCKQVADLMEVAEKQGFPVSQIVRHLICRYIDNERRLVRPVFTGGKP